MRIGRRRFLKGAAAGLAAGPIGCKNDKAVVDDGAAPDGGTPAAVDGTLGRTDGPPPMVDTAVERAGADTTARLDGAPAPDARAALLPQRILGRTNVSVSIVGFGLAPLGSGNTSTAQAERIVNLAIDLGITYLDVAPTYGNAEAKLRGVMRTRRREVFLVTKIEPTPGTRDNVLQQVQAAVMAMGVEQIDAVHIHSLGDWDVQTAIGAGGALDGLREAQRRGLIRFIGVSGHHGTSKFMRLLDTGAFDLTMAALNFADRNIYAFEGSVLPLAEKHGTGIVAMKTLGGAINWQYDGRTAGNFARQYERAVRFALDVRNLACAVVGLSSEDEVRKLAALAKAYQPLSPAEKAALLQEGRMLSAARGEYYGPPA